MKAMFVTCIAEIFCSQSCTLFSKLALCLSDISDGSEVVLDYDVILDVYTKRFELALA
jgi:hypothetical protein